MKSHISLMDQPFMDQLKQEQQNLMNLYFKQFCFLCGFLFKKAQMNLLREHVGGRIRVLDDGLMPLEVDVCRKPGNDKIIC